MQPVSLLLFCSWDRLWALMLIYTTNNRAICVSLSDDIVKHCYLTAGHTELHLGDEHPTLGYLLSRLRGCRHTKMTPFFIQPVGAPFYQWVGCRDHAAIACFPHCGSLQVQGGPAYKCRDQRKHVFHNMGPLIK